MAKDTAKNLEAPGPSDMLNETGDDDFGGDDFGETNQVECVNVGGRTVKFEIEGNRHVVKPGGSVMLHKSYGLPRKMAPNRDAVPSVVETLTNRQVLPVTDQRTGARYTPGVESHQKTR
jgi:hypothetical protein